MNTSTKKAEMIKLIFLFAIVTRVCNTSPVHVKDSVDDDWESNGIPNRHIKRNDIKKETPSTILTFISKVLGTVDQRYKMAVGRAKKSADSIRKLGEEVEKKLNKFSSAKP